MSDERISDEAKKAACEIIQTLEGRQGFDAAFDLDEEILDEIKLEISGRVQMAIAAERGQEAKKYLSDAIFNGMGVMVDGISSPGDRIYLGYKE